MLQSIAPAKHAAVERALLKTFGTSEIDSMATVQGGLSGAGVHRIRVGGVAYLLRLEGAPDALRDPQRWYPCMQTAAEAFIAPRVRYACAADGVAIMEYVETRSLTLDYAGSSRDRVVEIAQTVRALHETPGFPPWIDYLDAVEMLMAQVRQSRLWADAALADALSRYAEIATVYRRLPRDEVSSHNDLNPRNVLYDGRRIWFVDWESAARSDRYIDLASLLNFFVTDPADEEVALRTYFGEVPDAATRARLFLARQINHVFYGAMFLSGAAAEQPQATAPAWTPEAPDLTALHRELGMGEPVLDTWVGRVAYGKAHLAAACAALQGAGLAPALAGLGA